MRTKLRSIVLVTTLAASLVTGLGVMPRALANESRAAPNSQSTPFIIGGDTVESAPWGAQVTTNYGPVSGFCSGSTVAPRWVLTAAHCLGNAKTMTVRIGNVMRDQGVLAQVSETFQRGDTALLQLATPVTTTYAPLAGNDPPVGAVVEIYGWGRTGTPPNDTRAKQLKKAKVRITRYENQNAERRIRAVEVTGTAYHGDSGGPMFYDGVQIGTCTGQGGNELIYPSVANVRGWIRELTGV